MYFKCPFKSYGKICTHRSSFDGTSYKPKCNYNKPEKCPIFTEWINSTQKQKSITTTPENAPDLYSRIKFKLPRIISRWK